MPELFSPTQFRLFPLFQSFLQRCGIECRQMHPGKAVFRRQDEGLGQIVAGDDLTLPLRPVQKLPGALGGGGVVQIKNADDAPVPDSHVVADG